MYCINPTKKKNQIIKLFIEPHDSHIVPDVEILFEDEYIEIYEVVLYSFDLTEFFCYDGVYLSDLPVLIKCKVDNELDIIEIHKNFSTY